jgi:hypothetical protein
MNALQRPTTCATSDTSEKTDPDHVCSKNMIHTVIAAESQSSTVEMILIIATNARQVSSLQRRFVLLTRCRLCKAANQHKVSSWI